ncbi:MAG: hypothetical protein HY582_05400 [Candidatus Omnitrophica bacterium]|nr:hypothetical protein [Candidatus Omnitrophota bacterium]
MSLVCFLFLPFQAARATFYGEHEVGLQPMASDRYGASYYVPPDFTPDRDWPLVIVLYSDEGQKGAEFIKEWLPEIEKKHAIALFVSYLAPRNVPFSSDERILRLKTELMQQYPINRNQVLLTAYGEAAHYAFYLGAYYPKHFSSVALVAGGALGQFESLFAYGHEGVEQVAFLVLYGSHDQTIEKSAFIKRHEELVKRGYYIQMEEFEGVDHRFLPEFRTKILDWFQGLKTTERETVEQEAQNISSISFGIPKFVFDMVRGVVKS